MIARKGFKVYIVPLIALLAFCMLLGSMSLGVKANAASETAKKGIEVATDTITNYKMTIPLTGIKTSFTAEERNTLFVNGNGLHFWEQDRTTKNVTMILSFPNVLYNDKTLNEELSILVTGNVATSFSGVFGFSHSVKIEKDMTVNIRETYYNYFTDPNFAPKHDFTKIRITMLFNEKSYTFIQSNGFDYVFNISKPTFDSFEKPGGSNDPNDPGFDLGDNGGTEIPNKPSGNSSSFLENSYNFVKDLFGWTLTYEGLKRIVIGVLLVIGGILAISGLVFLIKIIVRIFRK